MFLYCPSGLPRERFRRPHRSISNEGDGLYQGSHHGLARRSGVRSHEGVMPGSHERVFFSVVYLGILIGSVRQKLVCTYSDKHKWEVWGLNKYVYI